MNIIIEMIPQKKQVPQFLFLFEKKARRSLYQKILKKFVGTKTHLAIKCVNILKD